MNRYINYEKHMDLLLCNKFIDVVIPHVSLNTRGIGDIEQTARDSIIRSFDTHIMFDEDLIINLDGGIRSVSDYLSMRALYRFYKKQIPRVIYVKQKYKIIKRFIFDIESALRVDVDDVKIKLLKSLVGKINCQIGKSDAKYLTEWARQVFHDEYPVISRYINQ